MSEKKPVLVLQVKPPKGVIVAQEEFERIRHAVSQANLPYEFLIVGADLELMDLDALREFAELFKKRVDELAKN